MQPQTSALPELAAYRAQRSAQLQDMLAAREGRPGYKRNAQAIRAELARLQGGSDGQA